LEIPFEKNYNIIYTKLLALQDKGLLEFAKPVLSEKHFKENSGQNEWSTSNKPKRTTVLKVS